MPATGLDLIADIRALKRERNAVILAHKYQIKDIQEVADYDNISKKFGRFFFAKSYISLRPIAPFKNWRSHPIIIPIYHNLLPYKL